MSDWARLRSLVDAVHVPEDEGAWRAGLTEAGDSVNVMSFINAHAFNLAARDPDFLHALSGSDVLLRDGSGMKILMKALGTAPGPNLNGTDLIPQIIDQFAANDAAMAFMGTEEPWLSGAAEAVRASGATVAVIEDGFQAEQAYLDRLTDTPCRLVVLGMGMPKQEKVSMLIREKLDGPILVINGGAILDFLGGKVSRAPAWMRNMGLEWLYRLAKEPRRLFGRYVIGNAVFLWRTVRLKAGAA